MAFPPDLDAAFKKFIPPFGASGNPGRTSPEASPPKTYQNTVPGSGSRTRGFHSAHPRLLAHDRHAGRWLFRQAPSRESSRKCGGERASTKPVVVSLGGGCVEVEEASEYLFRSQDSGLSVFDRDPCGTCLGAKYKWARRCRICSGRGALTSFRAFVVHRSHENLQRPLGYAALGVSAGC